MVEVANCEHAAAGYLQTGVVTPRVDEHAPPARVQGMNMALHQMKSTDWKDNETRCSGFRLSSGKRCKIMVEAGDYLCEHHAMDLPHFVQESELRCGPDEGSLPKAASPCL